MGVLAIKWLILTASVLIASFLLDGIHVSGFFSALLAAAAIGFLNLSFKPILFILTLPINIVTLGLFTFVVNAIVLKMASGLIAGFTVTGFWTAVFGAIIISIANFILASIFKAKPINTTNEETVDMEEKGGRWE
ncbi:MAG: phage holin family protein [Deltaproteobacteria bacterium]|nr:phage holin family protein [Deltaproteobacteria bacterium]